MLKQSERPSYKIWYAAHREQLIVKATIRNRQHAEERRATYKVWYAKTKDRRREANNKKAAKAYAANPVKFRARAAADRAKLRAIFIAEYGSVCKCCQESEPAFLTLEHKNRDGKAHRDSVVSGHTSTGILRDLRRRGWPKDNYELLCFNCNRASWVLGICPHRQKEKQTNGK